MFEVQLLDSSTSYGPLPTTVYGHFTSEITGELKTLNEKSKSMQKSDSIQPRSCLIQKKHVAELVRRRSKNLKFSEKIVGLVKITLNYIYTESRSIFSYSSYILMMKVLLVFLCYRFEMRPFPTFLYEMVRLKRA